MVGTGIESRDAEVALGIGFAGDGLHERRAEDAEWCVGQGLAGRVFEGSGDDAGGLGLRRCFGCHLRGIGKRGRCCFRAEGGRN